MAGNSVKVRIDGDASDFEKSLDSLSSKTKAGLADIKAGIDLATAAARKLFDVGSKGVNYNATIEQLKTSFEVMTGSAEKAADVVDRLRVMGAETPFEMIDLASTTQLLMQYGFTADEAIDRMRMLGDIAQGNAQNMNSIALGYAQMSSAGKVNLQDIKQMINAGFNPLQEISESTGESMASLYDRISKGTMTVDEITESMVRATSEGGKFFQSMEKQSQMLNGQLSTLKDNEDQLLRSLTEGMSDRMRDEILPLANNMISDLQSALDEGGYEGLISKATEMLPGLIDMLTGELQSGIEGLAKWLPKGAKELMKAVPSALKAASDVAPQIVTALFDVASMILGDLLVMLPELIPTFTEGLLNTFNAATTGLFKGIANIFDSIEQAMHKGQTKIMGMWVDDTQIAKYNFGVDVTVDETTAANQISTGISNIIANIGTALTDGLPDVSTVIGGLEQDVRGWADEAYAQIDTWYNEEIKKLEEQNLTEEEYAAAVANLTAQAQEMKDSVEGVSAAALDFITRMAGKSTDYVAQHLSELEEIGKTAEEVAGKIDALTETAMEQAQRAFEVVRSGATADEETISLAVNFKWTEFKMDEQAAEDAYATARDELMRKLTSTGEDKITQEEYDTQMAEETAKLEAAKAAAKDTYEQALSEIFGGVAEAEGVLPVITEGINKLDLSIALAELENTLKNETGILGDRLGPEITQILADQMQIDPEILKAMPVQSVRDAINTWAYNLFDEADAAIEDADSDKLQAAYKAALESGVFEGTNFDTEVTADQFAAILGASITTGAEQAKPEAENAGESIMGSASDGASGSKDAGGKLGDDFGGAYVNSILSWVKAAYSATYTLARSAVRGTAAGQNSASPSKAAIALGNDFGDGYTIGLQQSMERASIVARQLAGGIVTAADISQTMRVNVPNLSQEIMVANEQSQQPVNLFINGKELARVTAEDNQTSASWYNRRLAIGRNG